MSDASRSARGRPRASVPSIEKNLSLPSDLVTRVDLLLYSELEERVPHGAWARYIARLIKEDLDRLAGAKKGAVNA